MVELFSSITVQSGLRYTLTIIYVDKWSTTGGHISLSLADANMLRQRTCPSLVQAMFVAYVA